MEFEAFRKIERLNNAYITITQKLHGSNAAVCIHKRPVVFRDETEYVYDLYCQSRTRIITPESDNFGFAAFVHAHKQEFIEKLGEGLWFGEWCGPGINSGEGLTEKTFVLFNVEKFPEGRPLPPQTMVVPLLYKGPFEQTEIEKAMEELKTNGSKLVPGFTRPEGVVVHLLGSGIRWKKVFNSEESAWKKGDGTKERLATLSQDLDVSHLLQPIRLEKLLSRDEKYVRGYPDTLPTICSDYISDLIEEKQIVGSKDEIKVVKKALGGQLFKFVKQVISERV